MKERSFMKNLKVKCAKCGKFVDEVRWTEDLDTRVIVIEVRCHGEEDKMTFERSFLEKLGLQAFRELTSSEGVAFADRFPALK
jgi:hypothetical protein